MSKARAELESLLPGVESRKPPDQYQRLELESKNQMVSGTLGSEKSYETHVERQTKLWPIYSHVSILQWKKVW